MFEERTIWARHDDGAFCRAIPSIAATTTGAILAFSEARLADDAAAGEDVMYDEVPSHLALKRSEDLGATWSASILLERADGSFWAAAGRPGKLECWSQCCPVVDLRTRRIFVFYVLNEGSHEGRNLQRFSRVFVRESDDEGRTWSRRREITEIFAGPAPTLSAEGFAADELGRAFHICIGHGVQLASGRLIAPFWSRRSLAHPPVERCYGIKLLASDDHGASWRVLARFGGEHHLTESRLVELPDGTVLLNARGDRPDLSRWRFESRSGDGGLSWSPPEPAPGLGESFRCDAGLARVGASLLFAKGADPGQRRCMTVRRSDDGGRTWPWKRVVTEGAAYYCDLAALPDGTAALLYLKGRLNRWRGLEVSFARFDPEWVAHG